MTKMMQSKSIIAIRKNLSVIIARELVILRLTVGNYTGIMGHLQIRLHMKIMIARILVMII